ELLRHLRLNCDKSVLVSSNSIDNYFDKLFRMESFIKDVHHVTYSCRLVFSYRHHGGEVTLLFPHGEVNAAIELELFVVERHVFVKVKELFDFEYLALLICRLILILLRKGFNAHIRKQFHEIVIRPILAPKKRISD